MKLRYFDKRLILMLFSICLQRVSWAATSFELEGLSGVEIHSRVQNLERSNPQLIAEFLKVWDRKCKERPDCRLTEADMYKGGSRQRVLLFRGEPGQYDLPATSPLFRHVLKGNSFCQEPCNSAKLSTSFASIINSLEKYPIYRGRGYEDIILDERSGQWTVINNPTQADRRDHIDPSRLIPVSSLNWNVNDGHFFGEPFSILSSGHVDGPSTMAVAVDGTTANIDPFVSFSINPHKALQFATDGLKEGAFGRLIIASVPLQKIPDKDLGCHQKLAGLGDWMLITGCINYESYDDELEFDVVFTIFSQELKDVLTVNATTVK